MSGSDDNIKPNIETIFSLLPKDQATAAVRETLDNFNAREILNTASLKWAEFDMSGKFIRAGISDIKEQTTKIIVNPMEDDDIKRLVEISKDDGIEPGTLTSVAGLDCFLWFVPITPSSSKGIASTCLRGFCIWESLFEEVLQIFNPLANLTTSEKRICFQVVSGVSTREAASTDNVSVETKRSQIKSLCRKLQCAGQGDLIRKLLSQMIHFLSISEAEAAHAQLAEEFVANHLASHASLTIRRLSNGHIMRVLECGPNNGRPVIMVHGMMFAHFIKGLTGKLEELNLRLIIPLRHGHLETHAISNLYENDNLVVISVEDMALFLKEFGPSPAVIIGNSMGAAIAANFANQYPDMVSRLILLSPHLAQGIPTEESIVERFHTGLNQLVAKPGLFRLIAWQFRKYYVDAKTVQKVLLKLFGDSADDVDVLEGRYTKSSAYKMFTEHYKSSINGIAEDFSFVMQNWRSEFAKLRVKTIYLHGMNDPVTVLDEYQDIAFQNPNAEFITFDEGGHFMALSHIDEVWAEIMRMVEED